MEITLIGEPTVRPKVVYREADTEQGERVDLVIFNRAFGAQALVKSAVEGAKLRVEGHLESGSKAWQYRKLIVDTATLVELTAEEVKQQAALAERERIYQETLSKRQEAQK